MEASFRVSFSLPEKFAPFLEKGIPSNNNNDVDDSLNTEKLQQEPKRFSQLICYLSSHLHSPKTNTARELFSLLVELRRKDATAVPFHHFLKCVCYFPEWIVNNQGKFADDLQQLITAWQGEKRQKNLQRIQKVVRILQKQFDTIEAFIPKELTVIYNTAQIKFPKILLFAESTQYQLTSSETINWNAYAETTVINALSFCQKGTLPDFSPSKESSSSDLQNLLLLARKYEMAHLRKACQNAFLSSSHHLLYLFTNAQETDITWWIPLVIDSLSSLETFLFYRERSIQEKSKNLHEFSSQWENFSEAGKKLFTYLQNALIPYLLENYENGELSHGTFLQCMINSPTWIAAESALFGRALVSYTEELLAISPQYSQEQEEEIQDIAEAIRKYLPQISPHIPPQEHLNLSSKWLEMLGEKVEVDIPIVFPRILLIAECRGDVQQLLAAPPFNDPKEENSPYMPMMMTWALIYLVCLGIDIEPENLLAPELLFFLIPTDKQWWDRYETVIQYSFPKLKTMIEQAVLTSAQCSSEYIGRYADVVNTTFLQKCTDTINKKMPYLQLQLLSNNTWFLTIVEWEIREKNIVYAMQDRISVLYCKKSTCWDVMREDRSLQLSNLKTLIVENRDLYIKPFPNTYDYLGCTEFTNANIQRFVKEFEPIERLAFLNNADIADETIESIANHCPMLKRLVINNCDKITDLTLKALKNYQIPLESLFLTGCKNISSKGLLSLAKTCKTCKRISLSNSFQLIGRAIVTLVQSSKKHITWLDLSGCSQIRPRDIEAILTTCEYLETLYIDGYDNYPDKRVRAKKAASPPTDPPDPRKRTVTVNCSIV